MQKTVESDRIDNISATQLLKRLFNLKADTDKAGTIDLIKSNVEFQSANAWTLVFAILIASVGLNVNSAAVIIGAMLISPLMGPIVGIGFALGIYDFSLLKKSAKNLGAAVFISVMASTVYFLLSPLSEVQSELLARTRPSFFDVLIAFFGGAAGIVAISRKEKSNAIPGVAIATALMPPLCTAGFGLATRDFSYFFGAIYLFIINSVFISISTFVFVRYLGFHHDKLVDSLQQRMINRWITSVAVVVLVPSFFMAWYLQQESFFRSQANKYIAEVLRSEKSFVVESEIVYDIRNPKIKVTMLGDPLDAEELITLKSRGRTYSLSPENIEIKQSTFSENLERKLSEKLSSKNDSSTDLQIQLKKMESELNSFNSLSELSTKVSEELLVVFPKISRVHIMNQETKKTEGPTKELRVLVQWRSMPGKLDASKASDFLSKRMSVERSQILHVLSIN